MPQEITSMAASWGTADTDWRFWGDRGRGGLWP